MFYIKYHCCNWSVYDKMSELRIKNISESNLRFDIVVIHAYSMVFTLGPKIYPQILSTSIWKSSFDLELTSVSTRGYVFVEYTDSWWDLASYPLLQSRMTWPDGAYFTLMSNKIIVEEVNKELVFFINMDTTNQYKLQIHSFISLTQSSKRACY